MLFADEPRHFLILDLDRAHGAGRAGLLSAGLLPAAVEQMRVERPSLRQLQLLVPPDVTIRARVDELSLPFCFFRIDDHDAVPALSNDALRRSLQAWRIVAVIAHGRDISDVDHRRLPAFLLQNIDPLVTVLRHGRRIAGPFVADIFVHGCKRAQIAIGALGHVNDHVPFFHSGTLYRPSSPASPGDTDLIAGRATPSRDHRVAVLRADPVMTAPRRRHFTGSRCASLSVRLISLSYSGAAKAADMCSVRRSHSSISTSELAPASEWVLLVCVRSGVSRLRQPPRSTDLPGSPIGS